MSPPYLCLSSSQFLVLVGKGICEELAKRGQNIVLVSRTLSKLRTVAEELEQKYKVKTKVIDIDFSSERHVQQRVEADTQVCNAKISELYSNSPF